MPDETLPVSLNQLATLAIEHWRLTRTLAPLLEKSSAAGLRHSLRKIEDLLKSLNLEARSLDHQPYDPGLAATVIDSVPDLALPKHTALITETLSPLILHHGKVLRPAEITIATGPS